MVNYLGVNLKTLRKIFNTSQAQLGLEIGKGQKTIGNWETGFSQPNIEELQKMSKFFGVPLDDLISLDLSNAHLLPKMNDSEIDENAHLNAHGNAHPKSHFGDMALTGDGSLLTNEMGEKMTIYETNTPPLTYDKWPDDVERNVAAAQMQRALNKAGIAQQQQQQTPINSEFAYNAAIKAMGGQIEALQAQIALLQEINISLRQQLTTTAGKVKAKAG